MKTVSEFLNRILLACRKTFLYIGFFSFFSNALVLIVPLYMLQIFDRVLVSHSGATLFYLTLLAVIALFVYGILDVLRARLLVVLGHWLDKQIGQATLKRTIDAILEAQPNPAQSLADVQQIRSFLANPLSYTLFDAPWAPLFIFIIFLLHPLLGWFTVLGAVMLVGLAFLNQYATSGINRKALGANQNTQQQLNAAFHNAETIQAMGMLDNVLKHWQDKNTILLDLSLQANHRTNFILGFSKVVRLGLQVGILAVGAYLVIENKLTPGAMITASILLTRAYAPLEQSIAAWKMYQSARTAYERLDTLFATPSSRVSSSVLQPVKGHLVVNNVSFKPIELDRFLLKNIQFELFPNELLLVVGSSAAGKTTLIRLLAGILKPTEGFVRLDGADVYTWERSELGQSIGYLSQDIGLFVGTVQDNIARMDASNEEAIAKASHMAGAHDFILKLPQGYKTELRDAGRRLSGGQKQQIALARAFYKEPPLLILDEPTTYLDQQGQQAFLEALVSLRKQGSTMIIVSHHPELFKNADKILWLENGEIKAFGERERILQQIAEKRKPLVDPQQKLPGASDEKTP